MSSGSVNAVRSTSPKERTALVKEARDVAVRAHRGQTRRGGAVKYIDHPISVAGVLEAAGLPEEVVAAALLHDVVEDTELGLVELRRRFGARVAELVSVLTEDDSIADYVDRKVEHRKRVSAAGGPATAIYAADKLCNLRELRRLYEREGEGVEKRLSAPLDVRIRLWHQDLEMLSRRTPEIPFLVDLELELQRLNAERARRPAA